MCRPQPAVLRLNFPRHGNRELVASQSEAVAVSLVYFEEDDICGRYSRHMPASREWQAVLSDQLFHLGCRITDINTCEYVNPDRLLFSHAPSWIESEAQSEDGSFRSAFHDSLLLCKMVVLGRR